MTTSFGALEQFEQVAREEVKGRARPKTSESAAVLLRTGRVAASTLKSFGTCGKMAMENVRQITKCAKDFK